MSCDASKEQTTPKTDQAIFDMKPPKNIASPRRNSQPAERLQVGSKFQNSRRNLSDTNLQRRGGPGVSVSPILVRRGSTLGSSPGLQRRGSVLGSSPLSSRRGSILVPSPHSAERPIPEWEKEKQDLKSKVDELEQYKAKYEEETLQKQKLEQRLVELSASQTDASNKLMRSNEVADRLRLDNKKKQEQIEKFQRDLSFKDDRIRNLEIRASEVEKAELILETTKQNLESTVQQVKVRESEITRISKEYDEVCRKLDTANQSIKDLQAKVTDLKYQVRQELMKNDDIEKDLETIPRLKEEIREKELETEKVVKQTTEKAALLCGARKAIGEYKEKIRELEQQVVTTATWKEEVEMCRNEINTLKKLMSGKDYLVFQKSKALDLCKEVIEVLNDSSERDQVERIQHLIERMEGSQLHSSSSMSNRNDSMSSCSETEFRSVSAPPPRQYKPTTAVHVQHGKSTRGISVNTPPYAADSSHHHGNSGHHHSNSDHSNQQKHVFLQNVIVDMPDGRKRPVSALGRPVTRTSVKRTSSFKEAQKVYRTSFLKNSKDSEKHAVAKRPNQYKSEVKMNAKFAPSLDYNIGVTDKPEKSDQLTSPRSQGETTFAVWATPRPDSSMSDSASSLSDDDFDGQESLTSEQEQALARLTVRQKDFVLSELICVGDRVLIAIAQKPPRYGGKKKVLKPLNYTGIVKYKGKLDNDKYDARIHIGVRMDEPVGDTDGMYKGKRYMYTPADQGRFFKIRDVTSILDIKSGNYVLANLLMNRYINRHQVPAIKQQQQQNGH